MRMMNPKTREFLSLTTFANKLLSLFVFMITAFCAETMAGVAMKSSNATKRDVKVGLICWVRQSQLRQIHHKKLERFTNSYLAAKRTIFIEQLNTKFVGGINTFLVLTSGYFSLIWVKFFRGDCTKKLALFKENRKYVLNAKWSSFLEQSVEHKRGRDPILFDENEVT